MTTAPPKRQTLSELRELQRKAARAIMRPLSTGYKMQKRWTDNRPTSAVVEEFIKPNDRLTAFERIEIYNKQYWFRLIDCLYDDYPGLFAVLGRKKFNALIHAYLEECPSRSYTMRNLGDRLTKFIQDNPKFVAPKFNLATDMAEFEWARVIAFDTKADTIVTVDDLLGKKPEKLKLSLQPYLTLLHLRYPLDDFVLQLKQDGSRSEASNASEETAAETKPHRRIPIPRPKEIYVAVHRFNNTLYYKRLEESAFKILTALSAGKSVAAALSQRFDEPPAPEKIKDWFETWASLGWFCRR